MDLYDFHQNVEVVEKGDQPLWYNNNIKIGGKVVFLRQWSKKGINFLYDLCNERGQFVMQYEEFCEKFSFYPPITTFYGVRNAILSTWRDIRNEQVKFVLPACPKPLYYILTNKQRGISIYIFIKNLKVSYKYQNKWQYDLEMLEDNTWWKKVYVMPSRSTMDVKARWFQYRIIHRIICTNTYLHIIKIKNSPNCTFCNRDVETILHLFWECRIVNTFWQDLIAYINNNTNLNLQCIATEIIFGFVSSKRNTMW